jgi:Fe-S-cluster containining protein
MAGTQDQRAQARGEAFGYQCHRCMRCCRDKVVQVNPYEIARLARRLGQTTAQFRDAWTENGAGGVLAHTPFGACVLLGQDGCTVHPDRPLVCRIYPLGRFVDPDGTETWQPAVPHPKTKGDYTITGTIADFLAQQDVRDHIQAADDYAGWLHRAQEVLESAQNADAGNLEDLEGDAGGLIDMDTAIGQYCAASGAIEPTDIEARKQLHLYILHRRLDEFERGDP